MIGTAALCPSWRQSLGQFSRTDSRQHRPKGTPLPAGSPPRVGRAPDTAAAASGSGPQRENPPAPLRTQSPPLRRRQSQGAEGPADWPNHRVGPKPTGCLPSTPPGEATGCTGTPEGPDICRRTLRQGAHAGARI
ncbi:hypothetical protein NDU88_003795 [Pleurodeles waltl]|uniref:Uncharacterized protein n=1 Tax=Pleurodeles waltl TaxID=8319 RepID=A0AAV7W5M3_PLEWA|nr:hypothetical protein NDU88_003795 [Pleurodeles waltl]